MSIRERFRQSIKCGTGEAYFILRENPTIDFSKDITKAALSDLAYDGQSEGNRAEYLARLIDLSSHQEDIIEAIIKALEIEKDNAWSLEQLFELAAIFAQGGNNEAKKVIYKRYHKKIIPGSEWCGQDAIIKLDGIEGLKYIAAKRGQALAQDPDDWEDSNFVDYFQEKNPAIDVYGELESASKDNPGIEKYLDTIRGHEHRFPRKGRPQRPKYDYQTLKNKIEAKRTVPFGPALIPELIRELSKTDVLKLADDFLLETDPDKQVIYLRIFTHTQYPYDYHPILQIAQKPNSRKNRLVANACTALQYFKAPDIRQFAVSKLSRTNNPEDYLYLLVSNYEKDDYKLLSRIASRYKNEEIIHSLAWGYIDIYKANRTKECQEPLEILYEKLNCGPHRYELIEILHTNNVLSERILREIEFDSYEEIRELFQKIKAG